MCQAFHRLPKVEALVIHDEPQGIAPGTTAKAIVELPLRVDRERGGFFIMERTAGAVVFARFFKFYTTVNDLNNIESIQQVIKKSLWKSCHGSVVGVARLRALPLAARRGSKMKLKLVKQCEPLIGVGQALGYDGCVSGVSLTGVVVRRRV